MLAINISRNDLRKAIITYMKSESRRMLRGLLRSVLISLLITGIVAILSVTVLYYFFHVTIQVSGVAVVLGIIGSTLAFVGNNLVADALGRYNPQDMPQFVWGNRTQAVGFALTIAALLVK